MTPERESLIYKDILRAVVWGSEKADVFHTLKVNDITGDHADELYSRAWKERIDLLRSEGIRAAIKGAILLAGGVGFFSICWFGFGFTTRLIVILSVIATVLGGWRLFSGVMDAILAPMKKGSALGD